VTESTVPPLEPPDVAVQRRDERLAAGLMAPFPRVARWAPLAFGVSWGVALAATALRSPWLGGLTGGAIAAVFTAIAWAPYWSADLRGAAELIADHSCHELEEWRAETGTRIPIGVVAMERWLANHPSGKGRASVLLRLGRLHEADVAIEAIEPGSPAEGFGVEILRETMTLLSGRRPDLASLQAGWRSLPDPRERRHRRECLALLEAEVAVADGQSPLPILAAARREIGEVHPSMRFSRIVWRWALIGAAAIAGAAALGAAVS
jgi:hypothetical protein